MYAGTHVDMIDSRHLSIIKAHKSHGGRAKYTRTKPK